MIRHSTLAPIAGLLGISTWLLFFAKPLVIEEVRFKEPQYHQGQKFELASKGVKPWWSARLCEATSGFVILRDELGATKVFTQNLLNFNDGGTKRLVEGFRIPEKFEPGDSRAYKRVKYLCLKVFPITITSDRERDGVAVLLRRES